MSGAPGDESKPKSGRVRPGEGPESGSEKSGFGPVGGEEGGFDSYAPVSKAQVKEGQGGGEGAPTQAPTPG